MVRFRKQMFGYVEVDDEAVRIKGLAGETVIPRSKITSVSANKATGRVYIETGATRHRIQLWQAQSAPQLQSALS